MSAGRHVRWECIHGTVLSTCRCISPDKDVVIKPCPGPPKCNAVVVDPDTSGVMRCQYKVIGGHVHCGIFGPFSGKAGELIFRVEEWDHVRHTHPGWRFVEASP